MSSFELFANDNIPDIFLIEDFPCDRKEQLHARERHWIEQTPGCVNIKLPTRTYKEWYEANRETVCKKQRIYDRSEPRVSTVQCDCGASHQFHSTNEHLSSHKHIEWVNQKAGVVK